MKIRNTITGEIKEINPEEIGNYQIKGQAQVQLQPTEPFRLSNLLPLVGAGAGLLGGLPFGPAGWIGGPALGAASGEALRQTYRGLTGTGPQLGQQDVGRALGMGALAGTPGLAAATGGKVIPPFLRYAVKPTTLPFIGPKLEETVSKAGTVPENIMAMLREKLGTYAQPNVETFAGKAPGAAETGLKSLLKREISAVGRTASGERAAPTFQRLFQLREGAYKGAYDKLAPVADREFYKRLGNVYKELIHQGVPETQALDNLYRLAAGYEKLPEVLRYSFGTALPLILAYRILGRFIPRF